MTLLLHLFAMFMCYLLIMNLNQMVDLSCYKKRRTKENISFTEGNLYRVSNASLLKTDKSEKRNKKYAKFMDRISSDIDYTSYHSAIVQLSQQTELNIALVVDSSCVQNGIDNLTSKLTMVGKTAFCYQMDLEVYNLNGIIQFLLGNKVSLTVLFQSWYIALDILEKMKYYGLINMGFVTFEIKPTLLRHLQHENFFLKLFNLQPMEPSRMILDSKKTHETKTLSDGLPCSLMQHDSPKLQHTIISACHENPVKVLRVVTLFDIFVQTLSTEHVIRDGVCDFGLPCRVPNKAKNGNETIWSWQCCSGAFIDVLENVIRTMKMSLDLYIVEDGTYCGLVRDVKAGKADIALQQLTPSAERLSRVDFTPAVISTPDYITIVTRKMNTANRVLDWSSVQLLNQISFIGLVVATMVILVAVFFLENVGYVYEFNQRYLFRDSFSHLTGLLFQKDTGGTLPRRWPGQIVSLVFAFGMSVLVSAFTAQLTAGNIVEVEDDFQGLKDKVFQDASYKCGLLRGSFAERMVNKANLKAKKVKLQTETDGFDLLINKTIDAYFTHSIVAKHKMSLKSQYMNDLRLHNEEFTANVVAFAYSKQSQIGIKLSSLILQLTENGELQRIYKLWGVARPTDIISPRTYSKSNARAHHHYYSIEYGLPLVLILGIASVFCAFMLPVEKWFFNLRNYRKMKCIWRRSRVISDSSL